MAMTSRTPQSQGHFRAIKTATVNAVLMLYERETEARAQGDDSLGDRLNQKQQRLHERMTNIRKAEIAYLKSPGTIAATEAQLAGARADMTDALGRLRKPDEALQGASDFLTALIRLTGLF